MADGSISAPGERSVPPKKRRINGFYCAVAECNNRHGNGFTLHKFPTEPETRRQWIKFVQTCRADFGPSFGTPNQNSKVCSEHFAADCYPANIALAAGFGLKTKVTLKPKSVPTIQKPQRLVPIALSSTTVTYSTAVPSVSAACSTASVTLTTAVTSPICSPIVAPKQSVPVRGAFAKRERQRVLADALADSWSLPPSDQDTDDLSGADGVNYESQPLTVHASTQTEVHQRSKTKRNKKVQVTTSVPSTAQKGVQCTMTQTPSCTKTTQVNLYLDQSYSCLEDEQHVTSESETDPLYSDPIGTGEDMHDENYLPPCEEAVNNYSDDEQEMEWDEQPTTSYYNGRKFIVFEEELLQLFQHCIKCAAPADHSIQQVRGTMVRIRQDCPHCQHTWNWTSQPFIRDIPAGNLMMSAAILFSGSLPTKVLRFLHHFGVVSISSHTFFGHQRAFLHPCIEKEWQCWQQEYITAARDSGHNLILGGDGRADSPGHCAKYGTYSLLDLDLMQVVDVRTVQSNEAGNSCRMEKEGLQRAIQFIHGKGLTVGEIVTDRHPMIIKFIREEMKDTKHSIDVWHVGKGLKKKLLKLASQKECEELSAWVKSIINHLYWVAASTPEGHGDVMLDKWMSLGNHIHNVHVHNQPGFPACQHELITRREGRKKWIKEGSKLSVKLLEILDSKQIRKDIPMLSTGPQTAAIEGFHSVVNHFAPKMIGFSYHGILHRTIIAALHFNENNNRMQATDQTGKERFNLVYRKAKKEFSIQEVKVDCTYAYVERLMERVIELASTQSIQDMERSIREMRNAEPLPAPLCTQYTKPNKDEAVRALKSRYSNKQC